MESQFFLHVLRLAEIYAWKAYSVRSLLDQSYDNEPEAKDDEFDSFDQRNLSQLRLSFCENLKKMYVRQAWGSAT